MAFIQSINICLLWIAIVVHTQEYPTPSQQYTGAPQNLQQYNNPQQEYNVAAQPQEYPAQQQQQNYVTQPPVYQAPVLNSQYNQQQSGDYKQASEPGMPYNFAWSVRDNSYGNNDYGHQEQSDGQLVTGSYRVALPDGRTQIVTYRVEGDSGFVAEIRYEGQAQYPQPSANSYGQQQPQQYNNNQGNNDAQAYQPSVPQQPLYTQRY